MTEHFSGEGDVFVKEGRAHVDRVRYALTVVQPVGGRLGHIDVGIDLDANTARRMMIDNTLLTLRLEGGRFVDFFVSRVGGLGDVEVTATGGLRMEA